MQVYYETAASDPDGVALLVKMSANATLDTYTPADLYGPIANSTGYIFPGMLHQHIDPDASCVLLPARDLHSACDASEQSSSRCSLA